MKSLMTLILAIAALAGCNAGAPPEVAKVSPATKGEVKVLTPEDMKKLEEERKDMIKRPSPLGEEADPVEALRKQSTGK